MDSSTRPAKIEASKYLFIDYKKDPFRLWIYFSKELPVNEDNSPATFEVDRFILPRGIKVFGYSGFSCVHFFGLKSITTREQLDEITKEKFSIFVDLKDLKLDLNYYG